MKLPLQIEFRDLMPLPSLEGEIRERAARLEKFVPELMSCHVTVEAEGNRHHQGHRYVVRLDVRVPGEEFVTGDRQGDEQIEVALRGSFDAMTRQLEDYQRRRRGQVKHHASQRSADGGSDETSGAS
jgi:ribosome-associated translation inhibitor RaiA